MLNEINNFNIIYYFLYDSSWNCLIENKRLDCFCEKGIPIVCEARVSKVANKF